MVQVIQVEIIGIYYELEDVPTGLVLSDAVSSGIIQN